MSVFDDKLATILLGQSHVLVEFARCDIFENPQRSDALVFVSCEPCPLCKGLGMHRLQSSKRKQRTPADVLVFIMYQAQQERFCFLFARSKCTELNSQLPLCISL
ncbi:hypothetical protein D3H34_07320 [Acidovorax cavernicola]|uniref:Uncharacterized protein n=1 Tax=Acidovorax cavernicola TaxID=1675792 RepID=A0A9X8D7T9_9BURK|nr:hypothetical protein D3H34_07320 [Acidovorax cavernicola]